MPPRFQSLCLPLLVSLLTLSCRPINVTYNCYSINQNNQRLNVTFLSNQTDDHKKPLEYLNIQLIKESALTRGPQGVYTASFRSNTVEIVLLTQQGSLKEETMLLGMIDGEELKFDCAFDSNEIQKFGIMQMLVDSSKMLGPPYLANTRGKQDIYCQFKKHTPTLDSNIPNMSFKQRCNPINLGAKTMNVKSQNNINVDELSNALQQHTRQTNDRPPVTQRQNYFVETDSSIEHGNGTPRFKTNTLHSSLKQTHDTANNKVTSRIPQITKSNGNSSVSTQNRSKQTQNAFKFSKTNNQANTGIIKPASNDKQDSSNIEQSRLDNSLRTQITGNKFKFSKTRNQVNSMDLNHQRTFSFGEKKKIESLNVNQYRERFQKTLNNKNQVSNQISGNKTNNDGISKNYLI